MHFMMILIVWTGVYGGSVTSQSSTEFNSKEACLDAGVFIKNRISTDETIIISCVPKG